MFLRRHNYAAIAALALTALLYGCTTPVDKAFNITGSNKNSGAIELSFDYTAQEAPVVENMQPDELALQRCKLWGYTEALLTQAVQDQCVLASEGKCLRSRVTVRYQCK